LKLDPKNSAAHANMARALQAKGMLEEATAHFRAAVELESEDPLGHFRLGNVLLARGMLEEAVVPLEKAVELDPEFVNAHLMLGNALVAQGAFGAAAARFQETLAVDPKNLTATNALAWLLAACPEDDVRDGARAVRLIEPACTATGYQEPVLLSTLAAAYAEMGKFTEAVATANKALGLVKVQDISLARRIRRHLDSYRAGQPYRDLPSAPPR
jgi:tetratricopeptide (TPR) repeat protein